MCERTCPLHPGTDGVHYRVEGSSRRQFITQTTLAAVAAVLTTALAACGDGNIGGAGVTTPTTTPPPPRSLTIRIADFPALQQTGGTARVDGATSNPIAVTRLGPASFVALSMVCPHAAYSPIDIVPNGFRCPNHGATFAADGVWTGGQPTTRLQSYPTDYNAGAGTLTIG